MSMYDRPKSAAEYAQLEDQAQCASLKQVARATAWILARLGEDVNCFTFHLELKRQFPHAKAWHLTDGHILTEIDGRMYDKTGLALHRFNDPARFARAFDWDCQ